MYEKTEKNNTHRALVRLAAFAREYGELMQAAPAARADVLAEDGQAWDAGRVFLPAQQFADLFAGWLISSGRFTPEDLAQSIKDDPVHWSVAVESLATLAAWRMTRGIYRIDRDLYDDLINTRPANEMPAEVVSWLPEWCIYIEMHDYVLPEGVAAQGVWVRADRHQGGRPSLTFCFDHGEAGELNLRPHVLPFLGATMAESVAAVQEEWGRMGVVDAAQKMSAEKNNAALAPVLNLLLYICTQASEVATAEGERPANPAPKKVKKGTRLFAKPRPAWFEVGVRMGAALQQARQAASQPAASEGKAGEAPHVRRAHWHSWRYGPRKKPDGSAIPAHMRPLRVQWLPPIAVNFDFGDEAELPATVRPVRK